jgi:DNA-binding SARP family transcriptional activator
MFIRLVGSLQVLDKAGRDCTPRGAKSRALLALLCQTPDRRRARRWLESRLWSDRGAEQASGSLRQALMELRKSLGDAADSVQADRDFVQLVDVATDLDSDPDTARKALQEGRDFMEGIDVIDPAFLDWLNAERQRVAVALGLPSRQATEAIGIPSPFVGTNSAPLFVISFGSLPGGTGQFAASEMARAIVQLVSEFMQVEVFGEGTRQVPDGLPQTGLTLHLEGVEIQGKLHMMVSLNLRGTGQTVWSQRIAISGPQDVSEGLGEFPALAFQATEATLMQMPRLAEMPNASAQTRINGLAARAVTAMFSYDAARLRQADALLAEAESIQPSGRISAFRSLVRQIMYVERTEGPPTRLEAEADGFALQALEHANDNPLVLALVSYTRLMIDANPEAGTVLARDALRVSPLNPFGYWSMAGAHIQSGRNADALEAARKGAEIASRTAFGHSWESIAGLAAMRDGLLAAATAHYEAAHYRAPNFRAVMRPLIYLYLEQGAPEKAARVLKSLLRVEPDFSPASVLQADYPAITLRRSLLAEKHQAALQALMDGCLDRATLTKNAPKG